ncbi:MAG: hypothetical protein PG981_000200 [Wolbachia endosymbiont of Ctenocephalides orientis wCori]|nr:MAG: hypothetical protein PG981_000200 [Wolbachia endosymbiont of Ctenocephalides orientis wCori]
MSHKKSLNSIKFQVVKGILDNVISGNDSTHHLEILFFTYLNGVIIPDHLKSSYPTQMLIVLQHQFQNLKTYENKFSVSLSFRGKQEKITIPFHAMSEFRNKVSGDILFFDKFSIDDDQSEKHSEKSLDGGIISIDQLRNE